MINTKNLTKSYKIDFWKRRICALNDLSIDIADGETVGFLGLNGSGKTTTFKILTGLILPSSGTANIGGISITSPEARRNLGYLPESSYYYDYLTPREILSFVGRLLDMPSSSIKRRSEELLDIVGLADKANIPLRRFSKGMQQRLGVAQALLNDPKVVLLDEPMSGLDPLGRRLLREIIQRLRREGKTVFFSTHIISDVELLCDRVILLHNGHFVGEGTVHDLLGKSSSAIELDIDNASTALEETLRNSAYGYIKNGQGLRLTLEAADQLPAVTALLVSHNARIVGLQHQSGSLEEFFVKRVTQP